jgi:hypothetical protein
MSETGGPATPEPRHGPGPEGTGGTVPQVPEYGGQQQWAAPPPNAPQWNPRGYGKPGIIPLRPLTLGEILDGAITLIRRYPRLVLGVSAIVAVINTVLVFFANWLSLDALRNLSPQMQQNRTPQEQLDQLLSGLGGLGLSTGAAALFTVLTTTFLSGFLTVVVGRAALGRPVSFRDALDELRPRLPRLLVLTIVYTVLVFVGALCGSTSCSGWPRRRWCWNAAPSVRRCADPASWCAAPGGACSAFWCSPRSSRSSSPP